MRRAIIGGSGLAAMAAAVAVASLPLTTRDIPIYPKPLRKPAKRKPDRTKKQYLLKGIRP